jgi:hypothetical protein
MAEQSQFSKLSKKQLVFIAAKLVDEDFPIGNPYDDDFDNAMVFYKKFLDISVLKQLKKMLNFFQSFYKSTMK